jgi:hypothetical protein
MTKKDTGIVDIHGKSYLTVAYRIEKFREDYPAHTINTLIIDRSEHDVVMKAEIADETGRVISSGHAEEKRAASQINKTSALENCETSAIGRALAFFGLAGTEIASADEVANAIHQQNTSNSAPVAPAPSKARHDINERIKTALTAIYGEDREAMKSALIELTTWEKDGKTITGKPNYENYSDKQAAVVVKELEKVASQKQQGAEREVCSDCGQQLENGICKTPSCPSAEPGDDIPF